MPHINYHDKEIIFKLVYYGPGMSGKTTNLHFLHRTLHEHLRGKMVVLDTDEERTLFFDFLPLDLGTVQGFKVRINLYTVPGQIYYEASRRLIVDGTDGIIFVVDSQANRLDHNLISFEMMLDNLKSYDVDLATFPLVLQYNKRDCDPLLPVGIIEKEMGFEGLPAVEAIATKGTGVMETSRIASRLIVERFSF